MVMVVRAEYAVDSPDGLSAPSRDTQSQRLATPAFARCSAQAPTLGPTPTNHRRSDMGEKDTEQTQLGERTPDGSPGQDRQEDQDQDRPTRSEGDGTRPAQPDGTTPLEREQTPTDQRR
jgi:hypothetical protein